MGFQGVQDVFLVVGTERKLKLWKSPVGLLYIDTMLMCNIRNCIYPKQISQYFGLPPPSVAEYIFGKGAEVPEV